MPGENDVWFNINKIAELQKGMINDLSGNNQPEATRTINNIASNLAALDTTVSSSSVLPTLTYQNDVNRILEREKNNPINIIGEIYGVGPKKAKELIDAGITSIEQLRGKPELLNDIQRVGLKYYEDILQRIPRAEIDDYKHVFSKEFSTDSHFEIVGSYRRGALDSGDIDVIITSTDPNVS